MTRLVLVDVQAIAAGVNRPVSTVYRWAAAGLLTRHGTDHAGRALYDLTEAHNLATERPPRRASNQREHPTKT